MLWGETSFEECVATVHAAVEAGITLFDLAPRYGDGKAEEVVGAAFAGSSVLSLVAAPLLVWMWVFAIFVVDRWVRKGAERNW